MKSLRFSAVLSALALLPWAGANAQSTDTSGYESRARSQSQSQSSESDYDWVGPYVKLGLAIGVPDEDVPIDIDPGAGFDLAAGYRLSPWLAGEIDMNFVAGMDVEGSSKDMTVFSFLFLAKAYPFGEFEIEAIPDSVQPYVLFGLGGGEVEASGIDESTFMVRFGGGIDLWLNDNWGAYFDAGYTVIEDDDTALDGEGLIIFGGMYRF